MADNKAISIRVETSGSESSLVKNIIQDLCLDAGYTVVDRENSGTLYQEQDLKNNPRYNSGTGANTGNMIIATILIKIKTDIDTQYYYDIGGYIGGGYGDVDVTNYQTTMEYSVSSVELGTYSDIKTVTGSANDIDIYGRYKWIRGRYGEYSNATRTASIYDAGENIIPDIHAIAINIMDNYYDQTEGDYQPHPDPVSPQSYYPNSNQQNNSSNSGSTNNPSTNNNTTQPMPTDPLRIIIPEIIDYTIFTSNKYLYLPTGFECKIYRIDGAYMREVLFVDSNYATFYPGKDKQSITQLDPTNPTRIDLTNLGNTGDGKIEFKALYNKTNSRFYIEF